MKVDSSDGTIAYTWTRTSFSTGQISPLRFQSSVPSVLGSLSFLSLFIFSYHHYLPAPFHQLSFLYSVVSDMCNGDDLIRRAPLVLLVAVIDSRRFSSSFGITTRSCHAPMSCKVTEPRLLCCKASNILKQLSGAQFAKNPFDYLGPNCPHFGGRQLCHGPGNTNKQTQTSIFLCLTIHLLLR